MSEVFANGWHRPSAVLTALLIAACATDESATRRSGGQSYTRLRVVAGWAAVSVLREPFVTGAMKR